MRQTLLNSITGIFCLLVFSTCNNNSSPVASSGAWHPWDQFITSPVFIQHSSIVNPRERWEAYHLKNYVIQQLTIGAWVPSPPETVQIYVIDGRKALVVRTTKQDTMPTRFTSYKTVEDLFDYVDHYTEHMKEYPDRWDTLFVDYDPFFGFPRTIEDESDLSDSYHKVVTWNLMQIINPGTTAPNKRNNAWFTQ